MSDENALTSQVCEANGSLNRERETRNTLSRPDGPGKPILPNGRALSLDPVKSIIPTWRLCRQAWFVADEFAANGSRDKIAGDLRWNIASVTSSPPPPPPPPSRYDRDPTRSAFGFRCACRVGLRRRVTRRSDRGSGSLAAVITAPRRAAPSRAHRSGSIERKGKKSFRQTRIPEASRRYKDQGSMISVR